LFIADYRCCPLSDQTEAAGGGCDSEFLKGSAVPFTKRICLYGDVPVDVDPKVIVERVATLA